MSTKSIYTIFLKQSTSISSGELVPSLPYNNCVFLAALLNPDII